MQCSKDKQPAPSLINPQLMQGSKLHRASFKALKTASSWGSAVALRASAQQPAIQRKLGSSRVSLLMHVRTHKQHQSLIVPAPLHKCVSHLASQPC
jgi:hypothetical protein